MNARQKRWDVCSLCLLPEEFSEVSVSLESPLKRSVSCRLCGTFFCLFAPVTLRSAFLPLLSAQALIPCALPVARAAVLIWLCVCNERPELCCLWSKVLQSCCMSPPVRLGICYCVSLEFSLTFLTFVLEDVDKRGLSFYSLKRLAVLLLTSHSFFCSPVYF